MINPEQLLKDLRAELPKIEKDILEFSESDEARGQHLKEQYKSARAAGRTSEHFVEWRAAQITQAAVAWVLTCVFVRFLEDNGLLDEPVLSGPTARPDGSRPLSHARERMNHHFGRHPAHAEREYLLAVFDELGNYAVIDELLDSAHNPLWQIPVSDDGAKRLVDFFQRIDPKSGELLHDFTDPDWDTRFLGDLYQDLSESVRKRYALLQTPEFVEEFILDYTLTPAIDAFGLPGLRLIDPTCGSGHFLLTTFERVFDAWQRREPATNARHLAQRALDVVHGVDINPYAVAIARFRLLIAAMRAAQSDKIRNAPDFHFNLAVGDSLLHGKRHESHGQGLQVDTFDNGLKHVFETEDLPKLNKILGQRYHAVVGNPPYITVKDKALNQAYRDLYPTCHRKYSLGVPFTERFFDLTLPMEANRPAGFMGMITTNSFMKREFGKKLIEEYLPKKDVTHVIDTSGCLIPGHGTPTVIMLARNREPNSPSIRAVLGVKGEPSKSIEPADGKVWNSIVSLLNKPGLESEFVSVEDRDREIWRSHPWSMEGGQAGELLERIESAAVMTLDDLQEELGFGAITGEDDLFTGDASYFAAQGIPSHYLREFVEGDTVRNWSINAQALAFFPYDDCSASLRLSSDKIRFLWPNKVALRRRVYFGKAQEERGLNWYEYGYISSSKCSSSLLIAFAFVATHNHFVLDRGTKVFNRSTPVIKMASNATETDHFVLLGLLNSSVACFWGRQVFFPKGGYSQGKWEERLEWDGTKLKKFPIPSGLTAEAERGRLLSGYGSIERLVEKLDAFARRLQYIRPSVLLENVSAEALVDILDQGRTEAAELVGRMVAIQEELDWLCYSAFGIADGTMVFDREPPTVEPGQRAFEIQMAQADAEAEEEDCDAWFSRHNLVPCIAPPSAWSEDYRSLVERRIELIRSDSLLTLLERPEYKRRWFTLDWDSEEKKALRDWMLFFLERKGFSTSRPELTTCARLADCIHRDDLANKVAGRYVGKDLFDAQQLVAELVAEEVVPQAAPHRLKPAGIRKFRAWQETWDKQRQEDAIDAEFGVAEPLSEADAADESKRRDYAAARKQADARKAQEVGEIPLPPKYANGDFLKASYWPLRGKLDVPKERFFSLPGCEKPGDGTLVIGWAGLDHLQRAQAIAGWYMDRKLKDGWETEQLLPMLVALDELIPWLKQWHNQLDPEYGQKMGEFYEGFLLEELRELDMTRESLLHWQPAAVNNRAGRRRKTATAKE